MASAPDVTLEQQSPRKDSDCKSSDKTTQECSPWLRYFNDHPRFCYSVFGTGWILLGVWMFTWTEGCWIITSLYVITQIITTIGYGDITPTNNVGKILTSFYALGTILLLGALLNLLIESIAAKMEELEAAAEDLAAEKARTISLGTGAAGELVSGSDCKEKRNCCCPSWHDIHKCMKHCFGHWTDTIQDFIVFWLYVMGGTVFYATYEKCTCSYGLDLVVGCNNTSVALCTATGGYTQTWVTSFYMCVITLCTIGFGDFAPKSFLGRILFIPWAILGVMAMAKFATSFGAALCKSCTIDEGPPSKSDLKQAFESFVGERQTATELEFSWFLLHQTGRITKEDEEKAFKAFEELASKDGEMAETISAEQAVAYVQSHLEMFEEVQD